MQLSQVTQLDNQILPEDPKRLVELKKMKLIATALLGVAFVIFVVAKIFEDQALWVGFVRATAEAAMVGALADWFAVTALFRYPLGLKIPHTAIVPNRKREIGENLGRFVRFNFLSRDVISEKLQSIEFTRRTGHWLSQPDNSQLIVHHVAEALSASLQVMDDKDVQSFIEQSVTDQIHNIHFAPMLGNLLSKVTSDARKQELLTAIARLGSGFLEENQSVIEAQIRKEIPWWLPRLVDQRIYEKIIEAYSRIFQEIKDNPEHPLYEKFSTAIDNFVENLRNSPEILTKEQSFKEEWLEQPVVRDFSTSLWADLKSLLIKQATDTDSSIRSSIQQALVRFGETVLDDPVIRNKLDRWVENAALYLIERYGYEVEHLIANTIDRWNADDTSRKIESYVGKDLQYIRINGTVVGGLAGLVIHAFSMLF